MAFAKAAKDPFSTRAGNLIDKATIGTLQAADWGQFNHICDIINTTEEGPKDAVKALKKRIAGNRNYKELIECCMRNCGPSFHSLIVRKDFVKDVLAKVLKPKYNPPIAIQNRILCLIQSWATTYQGPIDVSDVQELYTEMERKGLMFPPAAESTGARKNGPIAAPQPANSQTSPTSTSSVSSGASRTPQPRNTTRLVPEQVAKLHSELDMVGLNISVMSAILLENTPGSENPEDMQLLQKLQLTCRLMQDRIMVLLLEVENDDVIGCLLQANDELNSIFLRYERFERSRARLGRREHEAAESLKDPVAEPCATCPARDLIDFTGCAPVPAVTLPACAAHFSSLSLENGKSAVGNVGQSSPNPFLLSRALPDIPVPNAVPSHGPGRLRSRADSGAHSLCRAPNRQPAPPPGCQAAGPYKTLPGGPVVPPQSVLTLTPAYSLPPGSALPAHTARHTGTNPPEIAGAELISLEFDPLSNMTYNTEAIYEDLDVVLNNGRAQHDRN
uniref:TOM1-like protein 1 n=1 Tax=Pristiophorus japonicus TaxID=55135 RepID=UPI00398EA938